MEVYEVKIEMNYNSYSGYYNITFKNNINNDEFEISIDNGKVAECVGDFFNKIILRAKNLDSLDNYKIRIDNQDNIQKCSKRIRYFDNNGKERSTQVYISTEAAKVVNLAHEIVKSVFNTRIINNSLYCINCFHYKGRKICL